MLFPGPDSAEPASMVFTTGRTHVFFGMRTLPQDLLAGQFRTKDAASLRKILCRACGSLRRDELFGFKIFQQRLKLERTLLLRHVIFAK